MRYTPYILAALHASLTLLAFAVVILNPLTEHMLGCVVLILIDLPWSLAFEPTAYYMGNLVSSNNVQTGIPQAEIAFALYFTLGTLWYYWIGKAIVFVIKKLRR